MKKEPLVYNFEGIDIPYFPSVTKTVITPEGETEVPQVPIFISRLKRYEKTKHVDDLIPACESLLREAINEANRANYVWYHGFMCRVVVSASCPEDTIYIDEVNGQVCGNEDFFYSKYWDADGDMMMVSETKKN